MWFLIFGWLVRDGKLNLLFWICTRYKIFRSEIACFLNSQDDCIHRFFSRV